MPNRVYPFLPISGETLTGSALSGAAIGVRLSYTVPAGRQAVVRWASLGAFVLAPTVQLRVTVGGVTAVLASAAGPVSTQPGLALNEGDTIDIRVSAAVAASAFDACLSVEEYAVA